MEIANEDEHEEDNIKGVPEAIKRLEINSDSKSDSDSDTDGENYFSQQTLNTINRKDRKRFVRDRQPSNTSVSNSRIKFNSNNYINKERQKIYSSFPQMNGLAPVF